MPARMRSNASIGKCSAGPSGGSSLFHVRHLAGVFSFKGQKPDCFFWEADALGKISVISEGEPRRLPDLGSIRTSYYVAALTEVIARIQYLPLVLHETRGQALLAPGTFS